MGIKKIVVGLFAGCLLWQAHAAELKWETNLPKALAEAKTGQKLVFMDFTGSDWCPACIEFHKEAMSSSEFITYAKSNLVLVAVDFPHKKTQSAELKKANAALAKKYNVEGYPTLILLDANGKVLDRQLGYDAGGIHKLIAKLKKFRHQ